MEGKKGGKKWEWRGRREGRDRNGGEEGREEMGMEGKKGGKTGMQLSKENLSLFYSKTSKIRW